MLKRMVEIEACYQCPYIYWNDTHNTSECVKSNFKVIYDIKLTPKWCPLPKTPICEITEHKAKIA